MEIAIFLGVVAIAGAVWFYNVKMKKADRDKVKSNLKNIRK